MHKCIMAKMGGSKNNHKLSKTNINFMKIVVKMYKFFRNGGKYIIFLEIGGEYAIFIIGLGGWTLLIIISTDTQ